MADKKIESDDLVGTVADIVEEVGDEKASKESKIVHVVKEVVEFVIHCFRCKNKPKTPILVHKDSVKVARPLRKPKKDGTGGGEECNSWQVSGICAKCGKSVRGFISVEKAAELGANISLKRCASTDEPAPKKAKVVVASQPNASDEVKETKE